MRRFLFCLPAAFLCILITVIAASPDKRPEIRFVPGEILVKYKPGIGMAKAAALNARYGTRTLQHFSNLNIHRKKLPGAMTVGEAINAFRSDPAVEYAEPNYIYSLVRVPNDASFAQLWGLNNTGQNVNDYSGTAGCDISAVRAWDATTDGSAKIVAVVDTGVDYNHDDIAGNMVAGYDFYDDNAAPMDSHGHGTHVAGTIGAIGDNARGVAGVNWTARIMPLRVGDSDGLPVSSIVAAIDYARLNGARIINASFGGYGQSAAMRDAISAAGAAGILLVAAAGNDSVNTDDYPHYPSAYDLPNILSVAATNQNDALCSFSNYGITSVHVCAPGTNVYSLAPSRANQFSENFGAVGGWAFGGANSTWAISGGVLTNRTYVDNADSWAMSPVIDFTGALACRVEFQITGACEEWYDVLTIEISGDDGATWDSAPIIEVSGDYSGGWYSGSFDIRGYDGNPTVRLRFHFTSDGSITTGGGFSIDNFKITRSSNNYAAAYEYMAGTSMATPHVAGVAALLWSRYPAYTKDQIRYMIINSVDPLGSLSGKVSSGGRVNIYNALNLPAAPGGLEAAKSAPGTMKLRWTDNSPEASGFKIEYKADAGGSYAQVAAVPTGTSEFSHTGAAPNKTVYYRVRSYASAGNSFYSNEASALTDSSFPAGGGGAPGGGSGGGGGGCFIATAAYGSPLEKNVAVLRAFRDRCLMQSAAGRKFVELYYKHSPPMADFISRHEAARTFTRLALAPAVFIASAAVNGGPEVLVSLLLVLLIAVFVSFRFYKRRVHQAQTEMVRYDP